ncbi:MAG TPA: VTT domain-containing protein [Dehalococcoidia bacterium]|nr:VTT domain-containing protein [Dehalococcoidia bacterium]
MESEGTPYDTLNSSEDTIAAASQQKEDSAKHAFLSRRLLLRIVAILLVVAITATIFVFRDWVENLEAYGYLGAFLISLVTTATIILPIPGIVLIVGLGAVYDPVLIGLAAGAGSALGELTGYMAGFSGQVVFEKSRIYIRLEHWMRRRGSIVILILSFVPNPFFDLAGAAAGVLRYPLWKFLLFCFVGKTLRYILVAAFGWFVGVSWF